MSESKPLSIQVKTSECGAFCDPFCPFLDHSSLTVSTCSIECRLFGSTFCITSKDGTGIPFSVNTKCKPRRIAGCLAMSEGKK